MPRSRSSSIESSTCASISREERPPVRSINRSASVLLPWSMCAMMEKLRIWSIDDGGTRENVSHVCSLSLGRGMGRGSCRRSSPPPRPSPNGEGENQRGTLPCPFDAPSCGAAILLHSSQPRIDGIVVEEVMADLALPVEQHRHLVAPLLLQPRMAVDVDHLDLEGIAALVLLQGRDELLAKVAILARQDGELGLRDQSVSGRMIAKRVPFSSRTRSATGFFGSSFAIASLKAFAFGTSVLFTRRITSPGWMPAASAAPSTASTATPPESFSAFFCSAGMSVTASPSFPGFASGFALAVEAVFVSSSSLNSPTFTVTSRDLPLRQTVRCTLEPGLRPRMVRERSAEPSTLRPSIFVMTSPASNPAFAAGDA